MRNTLVISEDVLPKQEIDFLSWKVSLQCDDKDYGASYIRVRRGGEAGNQTSYLSFFLHKCTFWLNFSPHESALIVAKSPKISQNFPKYLQNFSPQI